MSGLIPFPLELLPPELRGKILSFLDRKSLLAACCVSKSWLRVISPVSEVWFAACRGLKLLLADDIQWRMNRDIYVRLAQRRRSIVSHYSFFTRYFHGYYHDSITAIYYHDGKLATGFESGAISLWDCAAESWVWATDKLGCSVTSIKFDDGIFLASYSTGTVMSRDVRTGNLVRTYKNPCTFTRTVDYLSEADLVFSSESRIVAWEMSSGRLVLAHDLNDFRVLKMLVAPYPGEEGAGVDRNFLVAVRLEDSLMLWQATTGLNSYGQMSMSVTVKGVHTVSCPNGSMCSFPYGNELHFDGRLIYFVTHEVGSCSGLLKQWDFTARPKPDSTILKYPVKNLVGVGKKYLLIIASTGRGEEQMNIVERPSFNSLTRVQLCRKPQYNPQRQNDLFCVGRKSWLDGFDGSNDEGEIFFYVIQPHCVNYFEWHDRRATGYGPCNSGSSEFVIHSARPPSRLVYRT